MDAGHGGGGDGLYKYPDKGNMTRKEIDLTIKTLIEAKKAGQFRAPLVGLQRERQPHGLGEVVIQSMWSPAVTAVRTKGIACTFQPLKEGYRAWAAGFGIPKGLAGKEGRRGLRVHQLVPRRLGRRLPEPPGLLQRRAGDREGQDGAVRVGLLDGRQGRHPGHQEPQRRPAGQGRRRATAAATSSAWAASPAGTPVMDENEYMVRSGTSSWRLTPAAR